MDSKQLIVTIATIVVLLDIYYISIIPKRKQQKEAKKMQEELKKGDKIITYAGLSGTIQEVLEDRIIICTNPDKIKLSVEKWAVAQVDDRDFYEEK